MIKRVREGRQDVVAVMAMVLLALSAVFGGASRDNALRLALVELAALPLLTVAGRRLIADGAWRELRLPLALLAAAFAIPLVQLVPLPFGLWSEIPGREAIAASFPVTGARTGWMPISLTPEKTWASVLALLPPAAMFLAAAQVSRSDQRRLGGVWLIAATAGLLLGAAQLVGGSDSPLYLYEVVHRGLPVGFFANRNHMAAFLVASLPIAGAFVGRSLARDGRRSLQVALGALFFLVALVGIAALRSRAGVVLAGPALVVGLLIAWRAGGRRRVGPAVWAAAGLSAVAVVAVAVFALDPILARFETEQESRFETWPIILQAADAHLPLGAGVGAFDPVYRSVEPLETMREVYINQAHNDFLEIWLEAGWLGAAALVVFLVWWGRGTWRAWFDGQSALAKAASAGVLLLMLHSVVDYPLRTEALAVFFAFFCALLARPEGRPT